jgi:hypothetical protein
LDKHNDNVDVSHRSQLSIHQYNDETFITIIAFRGTTMDPASAVFGIEKSFSIFSEHIEVVGFASDIEKRYWEYWGYWIPNAALDHPASDNNNSDHQCLTATLNYLPQ